MRSAAAHGRARRLLSLVERVNVVNLTCAGRTVDSITVSAVAGKSVPVTHLPKTVERVLRLRCISGAWSSPAVWVQAQRDPCGAHCKLEEQAESQL